MTVKELLSLEISKKYSKKNKNINKMTIQKILEKGKDDKKLQYIFKLKFKEWIDIFTMKKKGNEIVKIDGLHLLLNKILENKKNKKEEKEDKNDEVYFVKYVYYLYNFENWFLSKKEKTKKKVKLETKK